MPEIKQNQPAEEYHANPAYGSTDIRNFLESPKKLWDTRNGIRSGETKAQELGTAFHAYLLEPETFASLYAIKPAGTDMRTKAGKEWREQNPQPRMISESELDTIKRMVDRMPPDIRQMLVGNLTEVSLYADILGIPCKARVDSITTDYGLMFDIKTINNINQIESHIYKYGYYIQSEYYKPIIEACTGQKLRNKYNVFCETQSPYRTKLIELDVDYQLLGADKVKQALEGIRKCIETGDWSDKSETHEIIGPPGWAWRDDDNQEEE